MFKRRPSQPQQEQRRQMIGQPQLLHTTYDQDNLVQTNSPVAGGGLKASSAPSEYFRRPLHLSASGLLAYRRFDPGPDTGDVFRPGHQRDVSSVYSRPSHEDPDERPDERPRQHLFPPVSATSPHTSSDMPITKVPDTSHVVTPKQSNVQEKRSYFSTGIPQSRKPKPTQGTLWDKYRGEPVKDPARGKPGSVQPTSYEKRLQTDPRYQVSISSGEPTPETAKKPTWGARAAKITKDTFDTRPPWKGGGGRTAIVDPVKDTSVPRSSPNFTAVREMSLSDTSGSNSNWSPASGRQARSESPVSPIGGKFDHDQTVMRNDSTIDKNNVSPVATDSRKAYFASQPPKPRQTSQARSSSPKPPSPTPSKVSRKPVGPRSMEKENRSPIQQGASNEWSHVSPSSGGREPTDMSDDPVSRFSWTTINTTTTYQQDSPPPSPPPVPVPALDRQAWRGAGKGPSVPDKPPTPPLHADTRRTPKKDLPTAPAVSKTMTHLEVLLSQDNSLALQKRNIQKVIHQLEQIAAASPLDVDWKTVKANKVKLEARQTQLAEVEREQHELGLAIARARRKAEREEGYESGLWVRKVTG